RTSSRWSGWRPSAASPGPAPRRPPLPRAEAGSSPGCSRSRRGAGPERGQPLLGGGQYRVRLAEGEARHGASLLPVRLPGGGGGWEGGHADLGGGAGGDLEAVGEAEGRDVGHGEVAPLRRGGGEPAPVERPPQPVPLAPVHRRQVREVLVREAERGGHRR